MLKEIIPVRQIRGEPRRRWFTSGRMDLVIWCGEDDGPVGFQLCYDKGGGERALSWRTGSGYSHMAVDDGENFDTVRHKKTPILLADSDVDLPRLRSLFRDEAQQMPWQMVEFIADKILNYQSNDTTE